MEGIKLPATIRWAVINCLLLWVAMSLYRGFLLGIFLSGNATEWLGFFNGMITDAGLLAVILVLYVLLTFSPNLHPFKSKKGKIFGLVYFIVWGFLIAVAYVLDLLFVKTVHYRMYGSKMLKIFEDPYETELFFSNISMGPLVVAFFLLLWTWGILILRIHRYISRLTRVQSKAKRITWQGWILITGTLLGSYTVVQGNRVQPTELNLKAAPFLSLRSNPVLCFFLV